jgi:hypothetical protein
MSNTFPQCNKSPKMREWHLDYQDSYSAYYRREIGGYTLRIWAASTPEDGNVRIPWRWSISHDCLPFLICSKHDLSLVETRNEVLMVLEQLRSQL